MNNSVCFLTYLEAKRSCNVIVLGPKFSRSEISALPTQKSDPVTPKVRLVRLPRELVCSNVRHEERPQPRASTLDVLHAGEGQTGLGCEAATELGVDLVLA